MSKLSEFADAYQGIQVLKGTLILRFLKFLWGHLVTFGTGVLVIGALAGVSLGIVWTTKHISSEFVWSVVLLGAIYFVGWLIRLDFLDITY